MDLLLVTQIFPGIVVTALFSFMTVCAYAILILSALVGYSAFIRQITQGEDG